VKNNKSFRLGWAFAALCLLSFGIFANIADAQETKCPFADDSVILYSSPTTLAKAGCAMNDAVGFQEELALVNQFLDKADSEVAKAYEKDDFPKKQYDYLSEVLRKASGQDSFVRSILVSYFKYVDCVVVAAELPESIDDIKSKGVEGLSLTLVFNANPGDLDPRKYLESEDLEILKEDDSTLIGKIRIRDGAEIKATIYFGGTILKDVDKYVIVVGSKANVEKKIERFQKTSEFVTKRLDVEGLVQENIIKEAVFAKAAGFISEKDPLTDPRAKIAVDVLSKIKGVKTRAFASKDGFKKEVVAEIADETSAQSYVDLANGSLAAVKLVATSQESLTAEQKLGLEVAGKVVFKREGSNFVANSEVSAEQIKAFLKIAKERIGK
jgi:hypothetical protein